MKLGHLKKFISLQAAIIFSLSVDLFGEGKQTPFNEVIKYMYIVKVIISMKKKLNMNINYIIFSISHSSLGLITSPRLYG